MCPFAPLRPRVAIGFAVAALCAAQPGWAQSLRGSPLSLDRQSHQAERHDFTYLRRPAQLERFVDAGLLVPVTGSRDYALIGVSHGVARPEVKLFLGRLGADYRRRCGERLVVTSLTRPTSEQPSNASARSVHPTGMAVDLRRPAGIACRQWLESTLLGLEDSGVLEATLEHSPPHYHVAIFPDEYAAYVKRRGGVMKRAGEPVTATSKTTVVRPAELVEPPARASSTHLVRRGETLWRIAQQYGTTVVALQRTNGLHSVAVAAGQSLVVPVLAGRR